MSREALVLLVCCCDFRDGAERLISSKSLRNAVIRAFPGLFRILRMCAPRRAAAVVRPRGREKSADRRRRILISRLLIIRASVPRRKSPFPAYFKGFPAVSPLIPPYPAFLKYPVSPQYSNFNAAMPRAGIPIPEAQRPFEPETANLKPFSRGIKRGILSFVKESIPLLFAPPCLQGTLFLHRMWKSLTPWCDRTKRPRGGSARCRWRTLSHSAYPGARCG